LKLGVDLGCDSLDFLLAGRRVAAMILPLLLIAAIIHVVGLVRCAAVRRTNTTP
jgi:hypothetical protein